jgi:hypothetical protein
MRAIRSLSVGDRRLLSRRDQFSLLVRLISLSLPPIRYYTILLFRFLRKLCADWHSAVGVWLKSESALQRSLAEAAAVNLVEAASAAMLSDVQTWNDLVRVLEISAGGALPLSEPTDAEAIRYLDFFADAVAARVATSPALVERLLSNLENICTITSASPPCTAALLCAVVLRRLVAARRNVLTAAHSRALARAASVRFLHCHFCMIVSIFLF